MEKRVASLADLEDEARRFVQDIVIERSGATLVTLSGELGAGKTAFTKAVAKVLGIEEVVTSPTFVIEKIYALPRETGGHLVSTRFARLVHIDAYRLESGKDLNGVGFDELLQANGNLIMLEWPEMIADALPKHAIRISLSAEPDGSRRISYG